MKRIVAILMTAVLLLGCVACSSEKTNVTEETFEIAANFSKVNEEGNIIVMVQDLGGVYEELYDSNGLVLNFINGDDEIYDLEGNKIDVSELECGDSVKITYDGKIAKDNPKTIKVYKISKLISDEPTTSEETTIEGSCNIAANFSKIDDSGKIVVTIQNTGEDYEKLYDENGLVLEFINGEEIYENDGDKIEASSLTSGDALKIIYDGKLASENPKTIRVYKIIKLM